MWIGLIPNSYHPLLSKMSEFKTPIITSFYPKRIRSLLNLNWMIWKCWRLFPPPMKKWLTVPDLPPIDFLKISLLPQRRHPLFCLTVGIYLPFQFSYTTLQGYCAQPRPFTLEHFTNYYTFEDPKANRRNKEFAERILEFGKSKGLTAYSLVAHSQGGLASLHLATYFWSGLDMVDPSSGRVIQTVGSPYQGCHLSGWMASVGRIFG